MFLGHLRVTAGCSINGSPFAGTIDGEEESHMRTHLFCRIAVVVGILGMICMAGVSYGQTAQTGALGGTASDPSGNVLPGVSVSVTNTATGQVRTTATQGDGRYMVPLLPPGSYKVEATRSGFKTATIEQVRVKIGRA